ncbi:Lectin-domain containing receptor kinase A4.3 [Hordeum vulgare]|nr:Lectin-domain containing receptor kinase A4.3 [Hordeum vulgare]
MMRGPTTSYRASSSMVLRQSQMVMAKISVRPKARTTEVDRSRRRPMTKLAWSPPSCKMERDGFPLNHVFSDDYDLEEEDEVDINEEAMFEDELATQVVEVQPKRKRRTKAYTTADDKLLCEFWRDIGQDPKVGVDQKASTFWIVSIVIQQECNMFCAIYESIKAHSVSGIDIQDMHFKL